MAGELYLGYRDDEPGYPIKLSSVSLGIVKSFGEGAALPPDFVPPKTKA